MTIATILAQKGTDVATIAAGAPTSEAAAHLAKRNFGALVVLGAADAVVGIVSERDIVHHLHETGREILDGPVSAIMTPDPLTCTRDGRITDVLQMMAGWHIRHLPVVEHNTLLGLVSMGDLIRYLIDRSDAEWAQPPKPAPDEPSGPVD